MLLELLRDRTKPPSPVRGEGVATPPNTAGPHPGPGRPGGDADRPKNNKPPLNPSTSPLVPLLPFLPYYPSDAIHVNTLSAVAHRFDEAITSSEYFSANPDRRRRAYNTHLGLYEEGCGLSNLLMSWTGPEYLSIVLRLNEAQLPAEALFLLRFRRFAAPLRSRSAYRHVMDEFDEDMLPMLDMFARVCSYQTSAATPARTAEEEAELCEYMQAVCDKYLPSVLRF